MFFRLRQAGELCVTEISFASPLSVPLCPKCHTIIIIYYPVRCGNFIPEDGDRFAAPTEITMEANAFDYNGRIIKVDFFTTQVWLRILNTPM
jgi:hypothetical protein